MTHDINAVGLAAGVVIGWQLRELSNLEAKLCEDVRHFKKASLTGGQRFCRGHPEP